MLEETWYEQQFHLLPKQLVQRYGFYSAVRVGITEHSDTCLLSAVCPRKPNRWNAGKSNKITTIPVYQRVSSGSLS